MHNYFDISNLFNQAFGFRPPANYTIQKKPTASHEPTNPIGFSIDQKAEQLTRAKLGSALYDRDVFGREYFMPVTLGGVKLWFPVISLQLKKSIVETSMVERRGSVKEIISSEDIKINIKGLIVNPDYVFPEAELIQLNDLFCLNQSIVIRSAITDIFFVDKTTPIADTYKVVITEVPVPPIAGVTHVRPYEIQCVSDTVFELEIK